MLLSHGRRVDEDVEWFFDLLKTDFELLKRESDDQVARWRRYGRVAHNARPGLSMGLDVLVFRRR